MSKRPLRPKPVANEKVPRTIRGTCGGPRRARWLPFEPCGPACATSSVVTSNAAPFLSCLVLPLLVTLACSPAASPADDASQSGGANSGDDEDSEGSSDEASDAEDASEAGSGGATSASGDTPGSSGTTGPGTTTAGSSGTATSGSSGADTSGAPTSTSTSSTGDTTSGDTDELTAAEAMARVGVGWNLGNSLDAHESETAWGNPPVTEALIQAVADAGFGGVRIPVTWSLHLGPGPDFAIDPAWMDRVEEVVGYVTSRNLYAIINLHHDGADGSDGVEWLTLNDPSGAVTEENNAAVAAQFVAVWSQIAARFADHGHLLVFESMNEIHDGYDPAEPVYHEIINDLNQTFVDLIRSSGGNNATRHLVVPGYNTNIDETLTGFEAPVDTIDDRLILSVHYYDPYEFALMADPPVWGAAYPDSVGWGDEDWVLSQFQKLGDTYVQQGLPVIIGEYGATHLDGYEEYRRYYVEFVTKAAVDVGAVPFYWDNGGAGSGQDNFALFDRSTDAPLRPDVLAGIMRASASDFTIGDIEAPAP